MDIITFNLYQQKYTNMVKVLLRHTRTKTENDDKLEKLKSNRRQTDSCKYRLKLSGGYKSELGNINLNEYQTCKTALLRSNIRMSHYFQACQLPQYSSNLTC